MEVFITTHLSDYLLKQNKDPRVIANNFHDWKMKGSPGEYDDPFFGKDGAYRNPLVNGDYALMHVHIQPQNLHARIKWFKAHQNRSVKTSDHVLVYTQNKHKTKFLLISILEEPGAHAIAEMKTAADREIMELFASVAEDFINYGYEFIDF